MQHLPHEVSHLGEQRSTLDKCFRSASVRGTGSPPAANLADDSVEFLGGLIFPGEVLHKCLKCTVLACGLITGK